MSGIDGFSARAVVNALQWGKYRGAYPGWHFAGLTLVKLARMNGVAPVSAFGRFEQRRLAELAASYGWCREFRFNVDGRPVRHFEITGAGWAALHDAELYLADRAEAVEVAR